jgi:hypothetical protein
LFGLFFGGGGACNGKWIGMSPDSIAQTPAQGILDEACPPDEAGPQEEGAQDDER